jgi:hypothetical protein
MATEKLEVPEKLPRKSQPEWPTHAREVRLKSTIRLPGQACDWFSIDPAKAKSGRAVVESLAVAPWGICITGGEKQFSEPVVNVPWAQVEYWVPA